MFHPIPAMANIMRRRILFVAVAFTITLIFVVSFNIHFRSGKYAVALDPDFSFTQNTSTSSTTRILLVSAFFPLTKSKHSADDYISWQTRFLTCITTEIYFFTTPDMEHLIRQLRGDLPITINTSFPTPFSIPHLSGLEGRYQEMHDWDREKKRHSPELYSVWNSKPYFLDEAVKNARMRGKVYDYAFWNDAGSFRSESHCTAWPDARRVDEVWDEGSGRSGQMKEDLLFFPITGVPHRSMRSWDENMGPVDSEFSEGSFFGGSPMAITWWKNLYYTYHDAYLANNIFVGKDQTLINSLFLLFPGRIISVWFGDPSANSNTAANDKTHSRAFTTSNTMRLNPFTNCGSEWFYYQWWFSSPASRETMADYWLQHAPLWEWLWKGRCELRSLLLMEEVLKRKSVFGPEWTAPKASLSP